MPSREPELYKDKIEVSLDGRQIFYLFFGGAVIVGLVFVLGVMVGRRVEARGHVDRADPSAVSDPLAALDRLERSDNLSFHGALTGNDAPTDVEKAIGEIEKHRLAGRTGKPESAAPASAPAAETRAAKPDAPPPAAHAAAPDPADKSAPDTRGEVARSDSDKPRAERRDGDKRDSEKRDADKRDSEKRDSDKRDGEKRPKKHDDSGRSEHAADGKKHGDPVTHPDTRADAARTAEADTRDRSEPKQRFTLQLASFQDRSEAEAFLGTTRSAGVQANLVEAEVNGKTFFRIRLGSYRSVDAANDAKADYEKAAKGKTAQVMRQ